MTKFDDDEDFHQRGPETDVLKATLLHAADLVEREGYVLTAAIVEASNKTCPRNTLEARAAEDATVLFLASRIPGAHAAAIEDANMRLDHWNAEPAEMVAEMRRVAGER